MDGVVGALALDLMDWTRRERMAKMATRRLLARSAASKVGERTDASLKGAC